MKRRIAVLWVLAMLPGADLYAQQQEASTTFRVTAQVQAACEIAASDPAFGTYTNTAQSGVPPQGTLLLRATCTPNSTYNVGLNEGASPGARFNQQRMVAGSQVLNYTETGTGTGLAVDHTLFGPVPASQVISAGDYANTITVRVYY